MTTSQRDAGGSAVTASRPESPGGEPTQKERWRRTRLSAEWFGLVAALLVFGCGLVLLWGIWDGNPAAAPFTRVGGETSVETAVDASRFWGTPQVVVETSATAPWWIMLGAAQCAMVHDAPLLFTSQDPKRQRLVDQTIDAWNYPVPFIIQSKPDVTACLEMTTAADSAGINGLTTFAGPYPLVQLLKTGPEIPTTGKLAPVVVFAAALQPGFLPDVAVGMALGAHMATKSPVSLVVVPRYLQADPDLEIQLESQHQLISGGVVLGQNMTVPDDTLALLRQLLTARDGHGVLAQVQDNLGSVAPVVAALLTLIGLGVADRVGRELLKERTEPGPPGPPPVAGQPSVIGPPVVIQQSRVIQQSLIIWQPPVIRQPPQVRISIMANGRRSERNGQVATAAGGYWRAALAGGYWRTALGDTKKVTIVLRSGAKVTGIVTGWYPPDGEQGQDSADGLINAVLRLDQVTLTRAGSPAGSAEFEFVLVSVDDIELIAKVSPDQAGSKG